MQNCDSKATNQGRRGKVGIYGQPAKLQHAHQKTGHEQATRSPERGRTHNVKRNACLHAENAGNQEEEKMANNRAEHDPNQDGTQAASRKAVTRHRIPKGEPQENTRVGLRCGFIPGRALVRWVRQCAGDVGREGTSWLSLWIIHRGRL